jgi:ketosteroid isomerase-like protein
MDDREAAVREATRHWLDATIRQDADYLDSVLDPGYTFTHATTGITDTREEWLESFRSGRRRYKSWAIDDTTVRLFDGFAIMTGHGRQEIIREGGVIFVLNSTFNNVWVQTGDGWKCAVWQATLVPDA